MSQICVHRATLSWQVTVDSNWKQLYPASAANWTVLEAEYRFAVFV